MHLRNKQRSPDSFSRRIGIVTTRNIARCSFAVAFVVCLASISLCCSIPVFRYALEHWRPEPYIVHVISTSPLDSSQKTLFNELEKSSGLANVRWEVSDGKNFSSDELKAIAFLNGLAQGQDLVIAEAVGNDYSSAARISAATGVPAILGWGGHEDQWRGSSKLRVGRFEDVNSLYTTTDVTAMNQILKKYGVTYVYVGPLERSTYGEAGLAKFKPLPVAFQSGTVTIYRASSTTGEVSGE